MNFAATFSLAFYGKPMAPGAYFQGSQGDEQLEVISEKFSG